MKQERKLFVVLGIHRSGTSALTRGLQTFGISLGEDLLPENFFNPKGHWEDVSFHDFNITLLEALGDRYPRILPIDEEEVTFLCARGFFEQAVDLLANKAKETPLLGLKNPRSSLLLPFWKKVFQQAGLVPYFLIALREPWSVAISNKNYALIEDDEVAFWTYISYLLSSLEETVSYQRIVVDYGELLINPKHQLERIARIFGLSTDPELLEEYCSDFIDPMLCHSQAERKVSQEETFDQELAIIIYKNLLLVAQDQESLEALHPLVQEWKKKFLKAHPLLLLERKNNFTSNQLKELMEERKEVARQLQKLINKNSYQLASLCQILHQKNLQVALLEQELATMVPHHQQ